MDLNWSRRTALLRSGAVACLGPALAWPGGAASAWQDGEWSDRSRARSMPWRLRTPEGSGPWPLIVYSHGLGGSRAGGDAWAQAWRAAGFAVLSLQHPGSDIEVLRGGLARLREAATAAQLLARVADVRFALDELERRQREAEPTWKDVDLGAIGMAGHSFGAQTTQAIAGQRFPVPSDLADSRPRAFIALSPSASRVQRPVQEQFGAIARPFLAVTGSLDGDPFGSFEGGEPRARIFEGLPPGQRGLLWLDGADHMTFAGNHERRINGPGPFARSPRAQQLEVEHHGHVARISALWWRATLLRDALAMAQLRTAVQDPGLAAPSRLAID